MSEDIGRTSANGAWMHEISKTDKGPHGMFASVTTGGAGQAARGAK